MSLFNRAIEPLEQRRLLTVVPAGELFTRADGVEALRMDWQGQSVQANPGRWIVQLNNYRGTLAQQRTTFGKSLRAASAQFNVERHMGAAGQFLVTVPMSMTTKQVTQALAKLPGLRYAEPDFLYSLAASPNDSSFSTMWDMHNTGQSGGTVDVDVDAPEAWDITTGSSDLVVGMVDSGIELTHPDLAANVWVNPFEIAGDGIDNEGNGYIDDVNGWDWWGNLTSDGVGDNNPTDQNNHGSHTAGSVGAVGNNSTGVVGMSHAIKMMALKIGGPGSAVSGADAVSAMNYVLDMRNRGVNVRVTNHSWGGGPSSQAMIDAISAHATANILFVAAAGNNGANNDVSPFYPATYNLPNIISVGNHTRSNLRSGTSNFGQTTVDLFAPGASVFSTVRLAAGSYGTLSGTSMAAPHVAGAVAMAYNVYTGNDYTVVRDAIYDTVDLAATYTTISVTGGRLNLNNLMESLVFQQSGDTLTINGTISPDKIVISYDGADISATVGPASGATSRTKTYAGAGINTIIVNGGNGNDTIEITNTRPATALTVNGGDGTDSITVVETASDSPVTIAPSAGNDDVQVNDAGGTALAYFAASQSLGSLSIANGGFASMAGNGSLIMRTNALTLNGSGTLDLNDNDLLLDYTGASQLPIVQLAISAARAGGAWTGNGLTSSAAGAASPQNTTLGVLEGSEYLALYGAGATFGGHDVDADMVLVKYTYYGDTDFNGTVNFDDYSRADAGFNSNLTGWLNGDFDGNGQVNFDDYSLLDLAFNTQSDTL